jgi:hypothetical protein
MNVWLSKHQFGPWALVTGGSSGIGEEFARQIAASGINVVLVARRAAFLQSVGNGLTRDFGVAFRTIVADLSQDGFMEELVSRTADLDIGLVVSNAGVGSPGRFLDEDRNKMTALLKLSTLAHLDIAHYFGRRLAQRKRGGLLFVGAMGAERGVPYMADDAAAKAFVQSFSQALHVEFKPLRVNVTVLTPGPTQTAAIAQLGLNPQEMPMKPMSVEHCVREGLKALKANRSLMIPGRMNRIMNAVVPPSLVRTMMAKMFEKTLGNPSAVANPNRAEVR